MSEFTCLLGEPALSAFRKRKLSRRIAEISGAGGESEAHFVYLIESTLALTGELLSKLQELVHGDLTASLEEQGLLLVVSRIGTQSPW